MLSLAVAASIDSTERMPGVAAALVHFSCSMSGLLHTRLDYQALLNYKHGRK